MSAGSSGRAALPIDEADLCAATFDMGEPPVDLKELAADPQRLAMIADEMRRSYELYRFNEVWQQTNGAGVSIAIIDSGLCTKHVAVPKRIVRACSVRDGDIQEGMDQVEDSLGHGTHCAGIVAAAPVAPDGSRWAPGAEPPLFRGLAPDAELLIYKVFHDELEGRLSDVALAVQDAVDHGADIIALSLQGDHTSDLLYTAIQRALAHRRTVICAAGNNGQLRQFNIGFPARYGGLVTVAAHTRMGVPSAFSSAGGEIDFAGPGEGVWSLWTGNDPSRTSSRFRKMSGTSMAAPWVAGVAALILAKHRAYAARGAANGTPILNAEDLREHLMSMAAHPGHHDQMVGYGPLWPGAYFDSTSSALGTTKPEPAAATKEQRQKMRSKVRGLLLRRGEDVYFVEGGIRASKLPREWQPDGSPVHESSEKLIKVSEALASDDTERANAEARLRESVAGRLVQGGEVRPLKGYLGPVLLEALSVEVEIDEVGSVVPLGNGTTFSMF